MGMGESCCSQRAYPQRMNTRFAFGKHGVDVAVPGGFDCHVAHTRSAPALGGVDAVRAKLKAEASSAAAASPAK